MSHQALCLLFLLGAATIVLGDVSKDEKDKILKGLEAGKEFTDTLGKASSFNDFTKALGKMNDVIGPWVDGIGIFSSVLGMFLPEDNAMLEAMKQGFKEVNERLDAITEGVEAVKEAIDWAVVKVNFQGIEQDIRLLDEKLKEVFQAPNPDHGEEEFIRVYENEYNEAGLLLWDSIVKDDQIFYENIVRAGMKYTNYRRDKMNLFMKGLIALIMKATNIEVGYEKFKDHDRGMEAIWKDRLTEVQKALTKADGVLNDAWADLYKGEVDEIAKKADGASHDSFRDTAYNFLAEKYPWRYWSVLSYDHVLGGDKHGVYYYPNVAHSQFRKYGRCWMISSANPDAYFNKAAATAAVTKDRECPHSSSTCSSDSAVKSLDEANKNNDLHGIANAAIWKSRVSWSVKAIGIRSAWGEMYLKKGTWRRQHSMFQFG